MSVGQVVELLDGFQYRIVKERSHHPVPAGNRSTVAVVHMRRITEDVLYWAHRYDDGKFGLPRVSYFNSVSTAPVRHDRQHERTCPQCEQQPVRARKFGSGSRCVECNRANDALRKFFEKKGMSISKHKPNQSWKWVPREERRGKRAA